MPRAFHIVIAEMGPTVDLTASFVLEAEPCRQAVLLAKERQAFKYSLMILFTKFDVFSSFLVYFSRIFRGVHGRRSNHCWGRTNLGVYLLRSGRAVGHPSVQQTPTPIPPPTPGMDQCVRKTGCVLVLHGFLWGGE